VLINGAGEKLLGRGRAEMLGHEDHELFPRELAERCQEEDEAVVTSGREQPVLEQSMSVGGETKVIEGRKLPIADADGSQHYVLGIVRDITEQKSLENQLRQVQRMDALGRLTGGIAHDFNNILAIIVGNADLLREQALEGSEAAEMTDEMLGAASHGAELVRRLLAFGRKQHLDPVVLNVNERTIRLGVHPAADLWPALIDPTQVDDALVNLAINARDAMPDGGSLTIETENVVLDDDYAAHHVEVSPGDYVMLAVSDGGTGMSPDVMARAFEPFFTTKPEGKGTGLGLSQVYGWVKQSGGHIKVYSEFGHGTTIKLYLPRAQAPCDSAPAARPTSAAAPGGRETVFVVEDNPNVRSTVLRQLNDLGYATIEAGDGASALAIARGGADFDLLLTDVVMPGGMTGYDVAEELGALRPNLKVLFTSGYTELAAGNAHAARAGPLLSKPYRKQDLGRAVRAVLDA
jgi:PAS domain S-box-containing protein